MYGKAHRETMFIQDRAEQKYTLGEKWYEYAL